MGQGFESLQARQLRAFMVGIVQWLERQIVALEVVGSTPTTHPIFALLRRQPSKGYQSRLTGMQCRRWGVAKR